MSRTPFDAPLRSARRELDRLETAIADAAGRLVQIEEARRGLCEALASEHEAGAAAPLLPASAYFLRARDWRSGLDRVAAETGDTLAAHRRAALLRYARVSALEEAVTAHRSASRRAETKAQEARVADLVATRFAARLRDARAAARASSRRDP